MERSNRLIAVIFPPKKLQFQCYWLFASSATVNLHKWLVEHKGEHKPSLRLIGAVRDGCKGKTMQSAKSWEAHWVYRKSLRHTIYLVRVIILSLNKRDAERRKKKFTFYLSIIFGHNLLFLSEFCRRRHGWVWRSDHSALPRSEVNFVSITRSVSQSAAEETMPVDKRFGDRRQSGGEIAAPQWLRGSVLCPCLCSLRVHCEFGAAAAAPLCFHPLPRLSTSSKPVIVQTVPREWGLIPLDTTTWQSLS